MNLSIPSPILPTYPSTLTPTISRGERGESRTALPHSTLAVLLPSPLGRGAGDEGIWRAERDHASARKLAENKHLLHIANRLTRELQALGVVVQNIDITAPRPRLYLQAAPLAALPLRGITRRRMDSEIFECSAWLDACEVVWSEFEDEVAA